MQVIKKIVEAGFDLVKVDKNGFTPLGYIIMCDHTHVVEYIFKNIDRNKVYNWFYFLLNKILSDNSIINQISSKTLQYLLAIILEQLKLERCVSKLENVKQLTDINETYICKVLNSYIRYSARSSEQHQLDNYYSSQRLLISIFFCVLKISVLKFGHAIGHLEMQMVDGFLQKGNDRDELIKIRDTYEAKMKTYFGADVSDDSDKEEKERKSYSQIHSISGMKEAAKGKIRSSTALSLSQDGTFVIGSGRNSLQLKTSEEICLWLLRDHLKRFKKRLKELPPKQFSIDSDHLSTLHNNFYKWVRNRFVDPSSDNSNHQLVVTDLAKINSALQSNKKITSNSKGEVYINNEKLPTKFFVPLFRGVGYFADRWTPEAYRAHYYDKEDDGVSEAILSTLKENPLKNYDQIASSRNDSFTIFPATLRANARELKKILLDLRRTRPILAVINGQPVLFNNLLLFLQHVYSNGIERLLKLIKQLREIYTQFAWDKIIPNAHNLFLSFGELPDHTLRYGFADKNPYEKFKPRPRWRADGTPEHPHVGKCMLGLFPLSTFFNEDYPHVIRQLRIERELGMNITIGPEFEVAFLGSIPRNVIFHHQRLRYPAFNSLQYPSHFLAKYGIDNDLYTLLRRHIVENRLSNSDIENIIEPSLYPWLKAFHGFNLLIKCYQEAHRREEAKIIFLTEDKNTFGFDLPNYTQTLDVELGTQKDSIAQSIYAKRLELKLNFQTFKGVYSKELYFAEVSAEQLKQANVEDAIRILPKKKHYKSKKSSSSANLSFENLSTVNNVYSSASVQDTSWDEFSGENLFNENESDNEELPLIASLEDLNISSTSDSSDLPDIPLSPIKVSPDVNQDEESLEIISAARKGDIDTVQELLERGYNINVKDNEKAGATALHWQLKGAISTWLISC